MTFFDYERRSLKSFVHKPLIDLLNPNTIGKILLELILAEQANAMRTNLKNQVMWLNMQSK